MIRLTTEHLNRIHFIVSEYFGSLSNYRSCDSSTLAGLVTLCFSVPIHQDYPHSQQWRVLQLCRRIINEKPFKDLNSHMAMILLMSYLRISGHRLRWVDKDVLTIYRLLKSEASLDEVESRLKRQL